jgi:hypothetical protein
MTVGGLVDTVFRFNRLCECHLYTAPSNKSCWPHGNLERVCTLAKNRYANVARRRAAVSHHHEREESLGHSG